MYVEALTSLVYDKKKNILESFYFLYKHTHRFDSSQFELSTLSDMYMIMYWIVYLLDLCCTSSNDIVYIVDVDFDTLNTSLLSHTQENIDDIITVVSKFDPTRL